jgi:hypothetical protein
MRELPATQRGAANDQPAHQHFGFGILTPDARHVVAAGCFGVYIGHKAKIRLIKPGRFTGANQRPHWSPNVPTEQAPCCIIFLPTRCPGGTFYPFVPLGRLAGCKKKVFCVPSEHMVVMQQFEIHPAELVSAPHRTGR